MAISRGVEGNAATYLEELRLSLLLQYIADEVFSSDVHKDVAWWKQLWADILQDENTLNDISDYEDKLAWTDLWQPVPRESESRAE